MNRKLLPAVIVVTAGAALATGHARGQTNVPTSAGDLILGFELSGSNDVEVDIGNTSKYLTATAVTPVTFGVIPAGQPGAGNSVTNINADLTAAFGSAWASHLVSWGIVGYNTDGGGFDIYETQDSADPDIPQRPGNSASSNEESALSSLLTGLGGQTSTLNSTEVAIVSPGSTNSWSSFNPGSAAFGGFSGISDAENTSGSITIQDGLSLWDIIPNGRNGGENAANVGTFSLDGSGDLIFTPASVPEPSAWLSIIGGILFLGFFRRRGARVS